MMTADKIKELIGPIHGISLIEDFIIDEAGSLKAVLPWLQIKNMLTWNGM